MLRPGGDAIFTSTTDVVRFCDITILEPIERSSIAFLRTVTRKEWKMIVVQGRLLSRARTTLLLINISFRILFPVSDPYNVHARIHLQQAASPKMCLPP